MKPIVVAQDVLEIAKHYGLDPALLQAVVLSEGDILRAVQCSIPSITTRDEALYVTCRSAIHAMSDYIKAHGQEEFVTFWGQRWAPVGAKNDPTNLNSNWVTNVLKLWRRNQ